MYEKQQEQVRRNQLDEIKAQQKEQQAQFAKALNETSAIAAANAAAAAVPVPNKCQTDERDECVHERRAHEMQEEVWGWGWGWGFCPLVTAKLMVVTMVHPDSSPYFE